MILSDAGDDPVMCAGDDPVMCVGDDPVMCVGDDPVWLLHSVHHPGWGHLSVEPADRLLRGLQPSSLQQEQVQYRIHVSLGDFSYFAEGPYIINITLHQGRGSAIIFCGSGFFSQCGSGYGSNFIKLRYDF